MITQQATRHLNKFLSSHILRKVPSCIFRTILTLHFRQAEPLLLIQWNHDLFNNMLSGVNMPEWHLFNCSRSQCRSTY